MVSKSQPLNTVIHRSENTCTYWTIKVLSLKYYWTEIISRSRIYVWILQPLQDLAGLMTPAVQWSWTAIYSQNTADVRWRWWRMEQTRSPAVPGCARKTCLFACFDALVKPKKKKLWSLIHCPVLLLSTWFQKSRWATICRHVPSEVKNVHLLKGQKMSTVYNTLKLQTYFC